MMLKRHGGDNVAIREKLVIGVLPVKRGFLSLDVAVEEKEKLFEATRRVKEDAVALVDIEDVCERE